MSVPVAELSRYAGLYWSDTAAAARTVRLDKGQLHVMIGGDPYALKPIGGARFMLTAIPNISLTFEPTGPGGALQLRATTDGKPGDVYVRVEPFVPTPAEIAEFAGVYRSDEMDAVYRMVVTDGRLRLVRFKAAPDLLTPVVAGIFTGEIGAVRFVRDAGRVSGFTIDAGRVRRVRFWKDTAVRHGPAPAGERGADRRQRLQP